METAGKVFSGVNFAVLKEPRGILKPLQWILSIFAFATTTGVTLSVTFHVSCPATGNDTSPFVKGYDLSSSYPFNLENEGVSGVVCNTSVNQGLLQGSQSAAQFYVFVGVITFLYCLAALVLYIFCDGLYKNNTRVPVVDFIISCVLVGLWLIGSSAWAQGVTDLKYYTDLAKCGYFNHIPDCAVGVCVQDNSPNFASLNVSIIFGFLNMCVWAASLWFLFKETPWHKGGESNVPTPGQQSPQSPQPRI